MTLNLTRILTLTSLTMTVTVTLTLSSVGIGCGTVVELVPPAAGDGHPDGGGGRPLRREGSRRGGARGAGYARRPTQLVHTDRGQRQLEVLNRGNRI